MTCHSIQTCYKIHGYPKSYKNDKRQAAVVQFEDEGNTGNMSNEAMSFTPSQYHQLL